MKKYLQTTVKPLAFALLALSLTACSSSSSENSIESQTDLSADRQTNTQRQEQEDYQISIRLFGDLLDGIVGSGKVQFTVWGYDNYVADVSATSVHEETFPIAAISEAYQLGFSADDLATTKYQSGAPDGLRYYITFYVDVDADGNQCNGDYRQDYDVSDMEFFAQTDFSVSREIKVTQITNTPCTAVKDE